MKKLRLFTLSLLIGCLLTSCTAGGKDSSTGSENAYRVLINGDSTVDLSCVVSAITADCGRMVNIFTDERAAEPSELVFGDTGRPISALATAELDSLLASSDGSDAGYVIYKAEDGSVAAVWNDRTAATLAVERFVADYCSIATLTAAQPGVLAAHTFKLDEYLRDRAFERLAKAAKPEVVEALRRLYDYIDGSALTDWMASLWEPHICTCGECDTDILACFGGAFYYADSARDYEGFLPDVESTAQALGRLVANGAFESYGNSYAKALPEEIKARIVRFCQSLQDEDSGYFYHPQWGSGIGPSRRGRDLNHAISLLENLGARPLYPTALERLEGADNTSKILTRPLGNDKKAAVSRVTAASSFEESLESEEKYLEWLYRNTKDIKINTQGAHTLASVRSQIKAAGYLELTVDYLDQKLVENYEEMKAAYDADPEHNPPPTGLWQRRVDYNAVWGLLKLYGFYNASGRALRYPVEAMRTCVGAIMIDADEGGNYHMNDVFNMWGAPQRLILNVEKHNPHLLPALYEITNENAPAMIDESIRKLAKFKQADGTFGYNQGTSSPTTQGVPVSLGLPEGDVNAVALAMDMYNCVYKVLGLADVEVKLCDYRDGERFIETIMSLGSAEKQPVSSDDPITFDAPPLSMSSSFGSSGQLEYIADPDDSGNSVASFTTKPGGGDKMLFKTGTRPADAKKFIFEADFRLEEVGDYAYLIQLTFDESYMLDIRCDGGKLVIRDNATPTSASAHVGNWSIVRPLKTWVHVKVEYIIDPVMPTVNIYADGEKVATSNNYFNSHIAGTAPANTFSAVQFWGMKKADCTLLLDNVVITFER